MQEEEPATGSAVMSRQAKDDFLRHYTVSDPRTHPKGYTEYKVTAQFISKKDPEDIKEVSVAPRKKGCSCTHQHQ